MINQKYYSNLSVDCVILAYHAGQISVLLKREPLQTKEGVLELLKLPGNHVAHDETMEETAQRILQEQTGAKNIFMKQFHVFSDLNRFEHNPYDQQWLDARTIVVNRVITVGFYSLMKLPRLSRLPLNEEAIWVNVPDVTNLILDHAHILQEAMNRLRTEALYLPIIYELLPKRFTMSELQNLYELITGKTYDKRNFRRKISLLDYIVDLNLKQKNVSHKPASLYSFDHKRYVKTQL